MEQPVTQKNRAVSVIWTLPLIALCVCAWLLYSSYKNAGTEIIISFDDASGITAGKTQVIARGVPIGVVKKIHPDLLNKKIKIIVAMEQEVNDILVEDTLFWIVRPELSASSVQGLDTILSGSYIGVQPGVSIARRQEFEGLSSPPPVSPEEPGLHFKLRAEVLGSIQDGTGIYYRNIEIGSVQKHRLDGEESVLLDAFIRPEYVHLVREGSRFSNASGVDISGKLPDIKVHIESLASLLKGGILLHTPEQLRDTPIARNGQVFTLYPDYESANYGIPMTLTLASSEDIVEGSTKVMFRGLEAGFVKEINFDKDDQRTVTAHILLDPRAEIILREGTSFWLVKPQISAAGVKNLRLLLSGAYITFKPGTGKFQDHFDILPEPPPQKPLRPGKIFVLKSNAAVDFNTASPVYFKNIQVGEVLAVDIEPNGREITTQVFIYEKYLSLLNAKTVFWKHSGVKFAAGLDKGITFSTGSLTNIISGGISFTSPQLLGEPKNFVLEEETVFPLFEDYSAAVQSTKELQPAGKIIHLISENSHSLSVGSPLTHKNIEIGEITSLQLDRDGQSMQIEILVLPRYESIIGSSTRFYDLSGFEISGGLNGLTMTAKPLTALLAGGVGCINVPSQYPESPTTSTSETFPLYQDLNSALQADRLELTIHLTGAQGLKQGSPVYYHNVIVGDVAALELEDDLRTVKATVTVLPKLRRLFRTKTLFWVETAEVDLSGVKNLENIIFGSYLTFLPGDGPPASEFTAQQTPPSIRIAQQQNFTLILETDHLGSLSIGSPIYYREVRIGQVDGYELSEDSRKVDISVSIAHKYAPLIRTSSRFWNISGLKIEGGIFSGVKISTGSFKSFMQGGIAVATPDGGQTGDPVITGSRFRLFDQPQNEWLEWNPDILLMNEENQNK